MKKILTIIAAAAIAISASAQRTAITANKFGDNWYLGINAGATTPTLGDASFSAFTPQVGVRLGKNLTTVVGVALEGNVNFMAKDKTGFDQKTFIDAFDVNGYATFNISNLLGGYKGEPRCFEVIGLAGLGWTHLCGLEDVNRNALNSKLALDFAFNLGENKAWQVYIEPGINYVLEDLDCSYNYSEAGLPIHNNHGDLKFNLKRSQLSLKLGVNYKFGCSNGTHNYAVEALRDQSEIDALNAKINGLRGELAGKDAELDAKDAKIAALQKALTDCENKPAPAPIIQKTVNTANLQPTVVFAQGKAIVEKSQQANVALIANYMKNHKDARIKISGYASPEGDPELNQRLSEARAKAVKDMLVNTYKISANRLETEGLGATDKLFDEVEFNRVAVFNDLSK